MAIDKTGSFDLSSVNLFFHTGGNSGTHWEIMRVSEHNDFPELFFIFPIFVNEVLCGATGQGMQRFIAGTSFDTLVTSEHLGPGLFQEEDPNLITFGCSTKTPSIVFFIKGESVINYDVMLFTTNVQTDCIATCFVGEILNEDILDPFWILGQRREAGQEVTVAAFALFDIVRVDVVVQGEVILSVDFGGALPDEISPLVDAGSLGQRVLKDTAYICFEVWIFERLLALDCCFPINRSQTSLVEGVLINR